MRRLAHSHVFGCEDFCESTTLDMSESVRMNGQIDWQAQQTSHIWSAVWQGKRYIEVVLFENRRTRVSQH